MREGIDGHRILFIDNDWNSVVTARPIQSRPTCRSLKNHSAPVWLRSVAPHPRVLTVPHNGSTGTKPTAPTQIPYVSWYAMKSPIIISLNSLVALDRRSQATFSSGEFFIPTTSRLSLIFSGHHIPLLFLTSRVNAYFINAPSCIAHHIN